MRKTEVLIIGGGAAGLFAACFLKKEGKGFLVLERGNEVGRKLLLTGHGRCNITNRKIPAELKAGYHEAGNFIYPAIKTFSPEDAIDFIENELKVPLKEEENNRMFPVSDSAKTVVDALRRYIGEGNIETNVNCSEITKTEEGYKVISDRGEEFSCRKVIVATGGRSYPRTGSDGTGYKFPESVGHTITSLIPALTSVEMDEEGQKFTSKVSGVSVNAGASLYYDNRKKASGTGDVLFTHKGLSGPVIGEISREIPRDIVSADGWIELDFTPGRSDEEMDRELTDLIEKKSDTKLTTLGAEYVPASVANALGERAGVTDLYSRNCDRAARKAYLKELKHLELKIGKAPVYETAYVTRGGVALKEIRRESMESGLSEGMYIIGEIADIDGVSGGYNLQACMSEAFIAVKDIIR
ncbi:MAG: aminoacetone oxidase family FAD-binding enzyme [Clostridiales bacterium]|nr:aminoacetone oxidase family FAD-binding enzyme [Clostridiales bacterium]